jgi:hypothetical protein
MKNESSKNKKNRIKLGPEISPGRHKAIREVDGEHTTGILRVAEGSPMRPGEELVDISEDYDEDGWSDCESLYTMPRSGPAQVATKAYCNGYERIFGKKNVGLA